MPIAIRPVRLPDVRALRALEAVPSARLISPAAPDAYPSATMFALGCVWQDVRHTMYTLVVTQNKHLYGFAQVQARTGREAWDVVRLTVLPLNDTVGVEQVCGELIDQICYIIARSGAQHLFVRAPHDDAVIDMLRRALFRHYADEQTFILPQAWAVDTISTQIAPAFAPPWGDAVRGRLAEEAALLEGLTENTLSIRLRRPADTWAIYQLYSAVTPSAVQRAEERSIKGWDRAPAWIPHRLGILFSPRQLVAERGGRIVGWLELTNGRSANNDGIDTIYRDMSLLVHPYLGDDTAAFVSAGLRTFGGLRMPTYCRIRSYDDTAHRALHDAGALVGPQSALLVRHVVARLTERQAVLALLRRRGLGIDLSRYQHGPPPHTMLSPQPDTGSCLTRSTPGLTV